MLRCGPDPLDVASVLQRLERLQVLPMAGATGWLPSARVSSPASAPDDAALPVARDDAAPPSMPRRASFSASLKARSRLRDRQPALAAPVATA
jgi:hypothetical protein